MCVARRCIISCTYKFYKKNPIFVIYFIRYNDLNTCMSNEFCIMIDDRWSVIFYFFGVGLIGVISLFM